jgi:hypothetical protein
MEVILAYMILILAYILLVVPLVGKSVDTFDNFCYTQMLGAGLRLHWYLLLVLGVLSIILWAFSTISSL